MNKQPGTAPTPVRIMEMAGAFQSSGILFAASDSGIFAHLATFPASTAEQVCSACGFDQRAGRLLLDACAAIGLLVKEDDTYRIAADTAAFLVPGQPGDLSRAIRYYRDVYAAWGHLPELLRSGAPVESPETHLGDDPARTEAFVHAMHGRAMGIGRAVVPLLDLSDCKHVLDVGGGSGAYSILIAEAWPHLSCTMLDLPGVARVARGIVARSPAADRIAVMEGDYHTAQFPAGQDVVLLFGMLHQESPSDILRILQRSRAALRPGGTVAVLDMMTDSSRCSPAFSAIFGLNMALTTKNGWVFSDADLAGWLRDSGFDSTYCRPLPPPMPHWLVTAFRP